MFERIKKQMKETKDSRDLMKRIDKLEKTVNHLQMELDISMDARVGYLETKITDMKKLKPTVDQMNTQIHDIYTTLVPKKQAMKQDDKSDIEVA